MIISNDYFQFLTQHFVNTIYRTQLLLSNDLPVCSDQLVYKAVSVDVTVQMFVIVATGRNISLVLTNPDGEFAKSDIAYTDGINNIWVYNGPYTGNWLFNIRSSGSTQACNFKVFQSVYHTPGRNFFYFSNINSIQFIRSVPSRVS
ncbi:unnamed protein product [Nippostrongylus brasiliensis]|uniref:CUB_2 domain-containing protein n=1 Tax=Nippostrongylus brasiliensis TaxID=27835 RepID=A0A0N4YZK4_NIPBR|nr:unnamed protein product [Nippostrongylus brasiliensis]